MDFIFYCIPQIPVPVVTLVLLVLAAAVAMLTRAAPAGDLAVLALATVGVSVGIMADCDLILLAALILGLLCVYLLAARLSGQNKGGRG